MAVKKQRMRWGVEKRLEFIEFRLFWEGEINRKNIMEQFGVSVPQASKDLSMYQEQAPKNLYYDKSAKRYFAAENFKPKFVELDADQYLLQLRSVDDGLISENESWLSSYSGIGSVPIPHRRVDAAVVHKLIRAIRSNEAVEIHYQSMNKDRPAPIWRCVSPHAFGHDGFRWHVRAFCHIDQRPKDFLLSRILDVKTAKEKAFSSAADAAWKEFFNVSLIPNPELSTEQQGMIALDYEMQKEKITIPVRRAMLYYFKKRLRLDVAEKLGDPQEAPVVIENRAEFEAALASS